MEPFENVKSIVTPLDKINVDTDQIIPKQFLKLVQKSGFGKFLFFNWRYDENETMKSDFILNDPKYDGSKILVTGDNFGCGSSREHAVWALDDYGFSVIISSSFADIFFSNCFKNGILPIKLEQSDVDHLMKVAESNKTLNINLEKEIIVDEEDNSIKFKIDAFRKKCLIEGLDDIGLTLKKIEKINIYEENVQQQFPWIV